MPGAAAKKKPAAKPLDPNSPEAQLKKIELFAALSDKAFPILLEGVKTQAASIVSEFRVFGKGQEICREGDLTTEFYVLLQGLAGIYKEAEGGTGRKYLGSLEAGSWFGEMSCMSSAPRSATVVAESECVVFEVPRNIFKECYEERGSAEFKRIIDERYRERALSNHLGSVTLFRGIPDKVLRSIGDVCELEVIEKGTAIVNEGEHGDAFFLIRTGHAKVSKQVDGKSELIAYLCENSFFGEVALIRDQPRSSTVEAVDRMDVVRVPKDPFLELLDRHPDVKSTVLERIERIYEEEFLSPEESEARERARELGAEHEVAKAGEALVIDMSKCTRCNMCVEGCIEAHEDRIPRIGKRGLEYGDLLLTSSCYNCKVPDCMLACKYGAIRRDRRGQVKIDVEACTGCNACEPACPYGVIHMTSRVEAQEARLQTNAVVAFFSKIPGLKQLAGIKDEPEEKKPDIADLTTGLAVKCDMCAGRSDKACIYNCPCGAIERIDPDILLGIGEGANA